MRSRMVALACAGLVGCGLVVGIAEGKKKHKGRAAKLSVLSSQQHQILDAGAIGVRVKGSGGRVVVTGMRAGSPIAALTPARRVGAGKHTVNLPLSSSGRQALGGCDIDGLRATLSKGRKKHRKGKKSAGARSPIGPLDRDLAVCSVGSENPTPRPYFGPPIPTDNAERCDFLDPTICMQPFPNDYFTKPDVSTATGRRLNFQAASMPHSRPDAPINPGGPIDPTDFNHADGFSPGSEIIIKIPEVETQAAFDNSGFVPITDLHRYADANQPVVVIDAATGERQPIWAEIDSLPNKYSPGDTQDVNLIIRPAKNFTEGHRYIVALRSLKNAQNQPVPPPMPFRVYRDRLITSQAPIENRRPHMEDLISTLQGDGIPRSNLYMAWDFTVASETSLAGRALALRNAALAQLGDTTPGDSVVNGSAPTFHITSVLRDGVDPGLDPRLEEQIDGELTNVPCYLDNGDCHPGGRLTIPAGSDTPNTTPTGTADDPSSTTGVEFRCIVPKSVVQGPTTVVPGKPGLFGHGLLGSYDQVSDQIRLSNQNNSVWCATKWAGFSEDDVPQVIQSLISVSRFSQLTDRMLQGFVNFTYLGRAMINPAGFASDSAFKVDPDGGGGATPAQPVIDTSQGLYYEGISQGAIMGGALTALSTDFTQSVLDVTGMNYSTLLTRSTDSGQYLETTGPLGSLSLYANYPNQLERQLVLSLMQLLWDRGEANGYAQHMTTDPLPGTPQHHVLLQAAPGDFQVSNVTAEVEARTIGASVYQPALDPGRHWDVNPFLGIPSISSFPFSGPAALVYYDGGPITWFNNAAANTPAGMECSHGDPITNPCQGTALAPTTNVNPVPGTYGADPHGYPRRSADGLQHVTDWLQPSGTIDQCGVVARPCYANGWTGP